MGVTYDQNGKQKPPEEMETADLIIALRLKASDFTTARNMYKMDALGLYLDSNEDVTVIAPKIKGTTLPGELYNGYRRDFNQIKIYHGLDEVVREIGREPLVEGYKKFHPQLDGNVTTNKT